MFPRDTLPLRLWGFLGNTSHIKSKQFGFQCTYFISSCGGLKVTGIHGLVQVRTEYVLVLQKTCCQNIAGIYQNLALERWYQNVLSDDTPNIFWVLSVSFKLHRKLMQLIWIEQLCRVQIIKIFKKLKLLFFAFINHFESKANNLKI